MKIILIFITILAILNFAKAQDIIKNLNGDEIKAKVLEITSSEIKYKKYTNPDGPTYTISVNSVEYIKYKNGDIDKFEKKNSVVNTEEQNNNNENEAGITNNNGESNQQNQNQYQNQNQQTMRKSYNLNHDVLQSEYITINSETNKEKIKSLITNLNNAIVAGNLESAWKIIDEIDSLNK